MPLFADLLTIEEYRRCLAYLEDRRRQSLKRVASSYIPEVSDKKLR